MDKTTCLHYSVRRLGGPNGLEYCSERPSQVLLYVVDHESIPSVDLSCESYATAARDRTNWNMRNIVPLYSMEIDGKTPAEIAEYLRGKESTFLNAAHNEIGLRASFPEHFETERAIIEEGVRKEYEGLITTLEALAQAK